MIVNFRRFFYRKIPLKFTQSCTIEYNTIITRTDKSFTSRWYCTAQLDLFFPEPEDAPQIVKHSQDLRLLSREWNLFEISLKHIKSTKYWKENWRENWGMEVLVTFVQVSWQRHPHPRTIYLYTRKTHECGVETFGPPTSTNFGFILLLLTEYEFRPFGCFTYEQFRE